jgi:hypothetical protein
MLELEVLKRGVLGKMGEAKIFNLRNFGARRHLAAIRLDLQPVAELEMEVAHKPDFGHCLRPSLVGGVGELGVIE